MRLSFKAIFRRVSGVRLKYWRCVLITAPGVAICVIAGGMTGLFQLLEWNAMERFLLCVPLNH